MEALCLVEPSVNKFIEHMSVYANADLTSIVQRQTQIKQMTNRDIVKYSCLINSIFKLNSDCQLKILMKCKNIDCWVICQSYCSVDVVHNYACMLLCEAKIPFAKDQAIDIYLRTLTTNALYRNEHNRNFILTSYRQVNGLVKQLPSQVEIAVERGLTISSIAVKMLALPVAILMAYKGYQWGQHQIKVAEGFYIPVCVNKIVNNIPGPVIRTSFALYDKRWAIYIASIISPFIVPNQLSWISYPLEVVNTVLDLPKRIAAEIAYLPITCATQTFKWVRSGSSMARLMDQGVGVIKAYRLSHELDACENDWVEGVKNLRACRKP